MRTPEGDEKAKVKEFLAKIGAYQFWPVQMGIGAATVDCLACIRGLFFGIETKASDGRYTARQRKTMKDIAAAGGGVYSGTADEIIGGINKWLSTFEISGSSASKD